MARPDDPENDLDPAALLKREAVLLDFERAWKSPTPPRLEDFYCGSAAEDRALLIELVHIDLEYRLRAGISVGVEEYLRRFPELEASGAELVDLIAAEYAYFRSIGRMPQLADYLRRFPRLQTELAKLLGNDAGHRAVPGREGIHAQPEAPAGSTANQPPVPSDSPAPSTASVRTS